MTSRRAQRGQQQPEAAREVAVSEEAIAQAIEAAYDASAPSDRRMGRLSPRWSIIQAVETWRYRILEHAFDRWPCDDEECPARPGWDVALDRLAEELREDKLAERMADVFRGHMIGLLADYVRAHPDAVFTGYVHDAQ